MTSNISLNLGVAFSFFLLTACIDLDSDSSSSNNNTGTGNDQIAAESVEVIEITAMGVKGPLAFADVKIFAFDPSVSNFYDKYSPISTAVSSQFAEIDGLSVPRNIQPPFILTVGGGGAVDLNTGTAPVISTLVTVITEDMLADGRSIFATPLTTLAFHMARHGTGTLANADTFVQQVLVASRQVSRMFAIDQDIEIDVLRSPIVINYDTVTPSAQEEAVHHRAASEALAAKVYELSISLENTTTDSLIDQLALDIQSDGVIDNSADGTQIGEIKPMFLSRDPMKLQIPNTAYRVEGIVSLMEEERTVIITDKGPTFHVDAIDFGALSEFDLDCNTSPDNIAICSALGHFTIGGGPEYNNILTDGDYVVSDAEGLTDALNNAKSGEVIYIEGEAEINLTEKMLEIPAGVTIASNRGADGSSGAMVFQSSLGNIAMLKALGDGVRITGLRIRGGDLSRREDQMRRLFEEGGLSETTGYDSIPTARGILAQNASIEVDNCELFGWSHAAISIRETRDSSHIHNNYIHHNQRHGLGYGVVLSAASALIEKNLFNWNRHHIAGTGVPGTSYEARYNVVLEDANSHAFDMHGGRDRNDGTDKAGDEIKIYKNLFRATKYKSIVIRGIPNAAYIYENWFHSINMESAIEQTNAKGNLFVSNNVYSSLH